MLRFLRRQENCERASYNILVGGGQNVTGRGGGIVDTAHHLRIVILLRRALRTTDNVSLPSQVTFLFRTWAGCFCARGATSLVRQKAMTGAEALSSLTSHLVKYTGEDSSLGHRVVRLSAAVALIGIAFHTVTSTGGRPKRSGIQKDPRRVGKLVGDATNNSNGKSRDDFDEYDVVIVGGGMQPAVMSRSRRPHHLQVRQAVLLPPVSVKTPICASFCWRLAKGAYITSICATTREQAVRFQRRKGSICEDSVSVYFDDENFESPQFIHHPTTELGRKKTLLATR
jgi:hypothetical protein